MFFCVFVFARISPSGPLGDHRGGYKSHSQKGHFQGDWSPRIKGHSRESPERGHVSGDFQVFLILSGEIMTRDLINDPYFRFQVRK